MDRNFNDIRHIIREQAPAFAIYLQHFVLGPILWNILEDASSRTNVYVFSGVIRNYLLGETFSRDIDIVVDNIRQIYIPKELHGTLKVHRNSFGGYKVQIGALTVDIWELESTWSLKNNLSLKHTPNTLAGTAFFNFSAIVFDWNNKRFIYDDSFLYFYKYKVIDVVNEENPNPNLCILNSIYYSRKLDMPIGRRLCKWIAKHYKIDEDYQTTQILHFHDVLFDSNTINRFCKACVQADTLFKADLNCIGLKIDLK